MKEYNKIVRDKIPAIIEASGKKCHYSTEDSSEVSHIRALERKLTEEVKEFNNCIYLDDSIEELGDIIEVCYAIAKYKGVSKEELDSRRSKKLEEKGGFEDLVFLYTVGD